MLNETISLIRDEEDLLHISLDNLRGDRTKLKDYRECDRQLRKLIVRRNNLEAAAHFHDGMLVRKGNSEEIGIVFETIITPGGHAEIWVSWDGKTSVVEQPELLIIDSLCLHQHTTSVVQGATLQAAPQQDTNPSGQLNLISTPQPFIEEDSPTLYSSKPTQPPLPTNSSAPYPPQTCLSLAALVRICPPLGKEQGLMAIAQDCFLKQSDFCDSNSLRLSYLKMSQDCSPATTEVTLSKSSAPSLNWGMWGVGNLETESNGLSKTEKESFLWVLTGNVQCNAISANRPTLQQCLDSGNAIVHRSPCGDRIYTELAPTLRSCASTNGKQGGSGAWKVREEDGTLRPLRPTECEKLMGWEVGSTEFGITADGEEIRISNTQRIKMLGNGIVPAEIEDLCNNLKPILEAMQFGVKKMGLECGDKNLDNLNTQQIPFNTNRHTKEGCPNFQAMPPSSSNQTDPLLKQTDNSNKTPPFFQAEPRMKQSNVIDSQVEVDNQSNYGILEKLLPARSLATDGGKENKNEEVPAVVETSEVSAMDHHTMSSTNGAANFKIGDRVKSNLLPNTVCTLTSFPSFDAAIVELESGVRERLLLKHLEPLKEQVSSGTVTKFKIIEELSPDEERERHRLELKVERAFYEAGCALRDLRDKRLYRSTHTTFEEYCKDRFAFTRRRPYQLIDAVGVVDNLCTNSSQNESDGDLCTKSTQILPTNEGQVRHLTKLQPEEQRTAWQTAVDLADGKVPTGKIVKGVVERLKEKPLYFASEYCSVGEIFRLQRLADEDKKYNGWWGIALEVENRLTVKCQVYDTTIEIRQDNIKRVDMTKEELEKQQEIIERVSRLARCNLDPAIWALLEVLNRQNYYSEVQIKMLEFAEQLYGVRQYRDN